MRSRLILAATLAMVLASCGSDTTSQEADTADAGDAAPMPPASASPASQPSEMAGAPAEDEMEMTIPGPIQGRWGLVAADCTSTRGDAKGLLTIESQRLRFYESTATLGEVAERGADRIRATFAFTGEGQTWSRDMTLAVADGGKTLVRSETGEGALAAPLNYERCPA